MIRRLAPAKINLSLEVLGRRSDGYHDIVSVFQTLDLVDELTFEAADGLALTCSDQALEADGNLALQAARRLQEATGATTGASIHLTKRIPIAAGLGGGSSDAAAALLGLMELWRLDISLADLANIAAGLGADVPFFLRGGTALIEGIGERITPLPGLPPLWVALVIPPLTLESKTATLYRRLTPSHYTDGGVTRALAERIRAGDYSRLGERCNVFEAVLTDPEVQSARRAMLQAGAPWVALSGSGSSLFCLFEDEASAWRLAMAVPGDVGRALVSRTTTTVVDALS
jgi:4-diphosphocytidyl-2-C-methyl-D-erythritol kinase